jgi:hypothetical protein
MNVFVYFTKIIFTKVIMYRNGAGEHLKYNSCLSCQEILLLLSNPDINYRVRKQSPHGNITSQLNSSLQV